MFDVRPGLISVQKVPLTGSERKRSSTLLFVTVDYHLVQTGVDGIVNDKKLAEVTKSFSVGKASDPDRVPNLTLKVAITEAFLMFFCYAVLKSLVILPKSG